MTRRQNRSWETRYSEEVHSPDGIESLKRDVRYGLKKKYTGIAESMWRYDGLGEGKTEDMCVMSQDTVPECFLLKNGQCAWFLDETTDQVHCLPAVVNPGINIYGKPSGWSPIPVGYTDNLKGTYSAEVERIRNLKLDATNSVLMRNDLFGGNDESFIDAMISELVDNTLTLNQLQLLARSPFVFRVSQDNLLTAKNFFYALSSGRPVIFENSLGTELEQDVVNTGVTLDPTLLTVFDHWESQIMSYLGIDAVEINKRAQMSISEVDSNDDKIYLRRLEKLNQREKAIDRINALFGTSITVVSVIDEITEKEMEMQSGMTDQDGESDADE